MVFIKNLYKNLSLEEGELTAQAPTSVCPHPGKHPHMASVWYDETLGSNRFATHDSYGVNYRGDQPKKPDICPGSGYLAEIDPDNLMLMQF